MGDLCEGALWANGGCKVGRGGRGEEDEKEGRSREGECEEKGRRRGGEGGRRGGKRGQTVRRRGR